MEQVLKNVSVQRAIRALNEVGMKSKIEVLSDCARSAREAADAFGIAVGQIASSIVFRLPNVKPLLVITGGRHRVDTELVARNLDVEKLHRADADFVREWSGYATGSDQFEPPEDMGIWGYGPPCHRPPRCRDKRNVLLVSLHS